MSDDGSIDNFPIELLAAYVDDELDARTRRRVELWLEEHPEALADMLDQEGLSRVNDDYWQSVAPAMPSNDTWERTLAGIESSLEQRSPRRRAGSRRLPYLGSVLALTGMAAALMIALVFVERQPPGVIRPVAAPVIAALPVHQEELAAYEVATDDDVELKQLPEEATDLLVVGKHPLHGMELVFASSLEVQVLNYGLDDQGEVADYQEMRGPNTPMFVAPPRRK